MTDRERLIADLRKMVEDSQSVSVLNNLDKRDTDVLFRGFTEWCRKKGIPVPMDEETFVQKVCEYLGLTTSYDSYNASNGTVMTRRIFTVSEE